MTKRKGEPLQPMQVNQGMVKGLGAQIARVTEPGSDMHHFYINGVIKSAEHYVDLIHTLRGCGQGDIIYLHINTPGGHLFTVTQILHAIIDCPGTVVTVAEGSVYSGGSILFLAGHQMVVGEFSSFMAHDVQTADSDNLYGMEGRIAHVRKLYDRICDRVYKPFLTKKEMNEIRRGGSVYLDAPELTERLMKVSKKVAKS